MAVPSFVPLDVQEKTKTPFGSGWDTALQSRTALSCAWEQTAFRVTRGSHRELVLPSLVFYIDLAAPAAVAVAKSATEIGVMHLNL